MIRVSHFGKMGDLVYALPVMRALARTRGDKIHLMTSPLCFGMAPLLWEQPYIEDVQIDCVRPYKMADGVMSGWDFYKDGEGFNLSPQPAFYRDEAPIPWTHCYAEAANVSAFDTADFVAFPSLVNHRRWHFAHEVKMDGRPVEFAKTIVLAPESESLEAPPLELWREIAYTLCSRFTIIVVGMKKDTLFSSISRIKDLRGATTVPTLARIIAEAHGFIGAHSFPWHLARHSETPAVCLQKWSPGLQRCIPIDTACTWIEPENYREAIKKITDEDEKWRESARS